MPVLPDGQKSALTGDWSFHQDGNAVQGFAIRTTTECLKMLQDQYEAEAQRFIFIGHQANFMMLKTVCERRGDKARKTTGTTLINSAISAAAALLRF